MARRARYRPNNSMGDGFGGFMLSEQARDPVMAIGRTMAAEAAATDGTSIAGDYDVERGPVVVVAGNPRVSVRVTNNNEKAAAYEFGSGFMAEGQSDGEARTGQQKGASPARRHLGYIAAGYHDVIGDPG